MYYQQGLSENQRDLLNTSIAPKNNVLCGEFKCKVCDKTIYWIDFIGDTYDINPEEHYERAKANVYVPCEQSKTLIPPYESVEAKIYVECPHCRYKVIGTTNIRIKE